MASNEVVFRKHKIAYLQILLKYGIWLLVCLIALGYLLTTTSWKVPPILVLIVLAVIAVSLFFAYRSWMETKNFTWTLTEEGLVRRWGWLSWQKGSYDVPYDTIFEAYYREGFFAKQFGYQECEIRRMEGVTSRMTATYMANGVELVRAINRKVKELRAMQHMANPMMHPMLNQFVSEAPAAENGSKSMAEQLREIAALKAEGTITADEFDLMKRKIIQA